jgi:hypothetical protein
MAIWRGMCHSTFRSPKTPKCTSDPYTHTGVPAEVLRVERSVAGSQNGKKWQYYGPLQASVHRCKSAAPTGGPWPSAVLLRLVGCCKRKIMHPSAAELPTTSQLGLAPEQAGSPSNRPGSGSFADSSHVVKSLLMGVFVIQPSL